MSDPVKQIAMRSLDLREISDYTVQQMADALCVPVEEYRKYESGEVDMPISFLVKIGEVFHVDMTELLTGEAPRLSVLSVTGQAKARTLSVMTNTRKRTWPITLPHRKIEPLYVNRSPGTNGRWCPTAMEGQEFDYILSGVMRMVIGKNEVVLRPGDSVYYNSSTPHAMQAVGEEPVHFLAMVIP